MVAGFMRSGPGVTVSGSWTTVSGARPGMEPAVPAAAAALRSRIRRRQPPSFSSGARWGWVVTETPDRGRSLSRETMAATLLMF